MKQSIRDVVTGDLGLEYFAKRFGEGWKIASIEWSRDAGTAEAADSDITTPLLAEESALLPYGVRVTDAGTVEENPLEVTVLLLILEQIIREKRITEIATQLNQQGLRTRMGDPWSPTDVFNLLPRLIETGPSLLKSAAWRQRRPATQTSPEKLN